MTKKSVLIISHDKIGENMAGPGIRYHFMAESLSKDFNVTVGFFDPSYLPDPSFKKKYKTTSIDATRFESVFEENSIVIALWLNESMISFCNNKRIFTVFDLYAPVPVENLASKLFSGLPLTEGDDFEYKRSLEMYRLFFAQGDLYLFSNRRQLDYWTGFVFGADQVRVTTYNKRPFYERFIYAPMGIDTSIPLNHTAKVMREVIPGISNTDKILLWTGGIWNWYDGEVLIKAMDRIKSSHPDVKLVFFGTKHPNPDVPEMKEAAQTYELAKRLGILNKTVFMSDGWVPYNERINYLLEADVAVNTSKPSIEAEFSHRTRVLDHILAELPTISTEGDYISDEYITPKKLGIVVPPNDVDSLSEAIISIFEVKTYEKFKKSLSAVRAQFDWTSTLHELKVTLDSNPDKLSTLPHNKLFPIARSRSPLYMNTKKIIPTWAKKILIKVARYGK